MALQRYRAGNEPESNDPQSLPLDTPSSFTLDAPSSSSLDSYDLACSNCLTALLKIFGDRFRCEKFFGLYAPNKCVENTGTGSKTQIVKTMQKHMLKVEEERKDTNAAAFLALIASKRNAQLNIAIIGLYRNILTQHATCMVQFPNEQGDLLTTTAGFNFAPSRYWRSIRGRARKVLMSTRQVIGNQPQFGFCCPDVTVGDIFKHGDGCEIKVLAFFETQLLDAGMNNFIQRVSSELCKILRGNVEVPKNLGYNLGNHLDIPAPTVLE